MSVFNCQILYLSDNFNFRKKKKKKENNIKTFKIKISIFSFINYKGKSNILTIFILHTVSYDSRTKLEIFRYCKCTLFTDRTTRKRLRTAENTTTNMPIFCLRFKSRHHATMWLVPWSHCCQRLF